MYRGASSLWYKVSGPVRSDSDVQRKPWRPITMMAGRYWRHGRGLLVASTCVTWPGGAPCPRAGRGVTGQLALSDCGPPTVHQPIRCHQSSVCPGWGWGGSTASLKVGTHCQTTALAFPPSLPMLLSNVCPSVFFNRPLFLYSQYKSTYKRDTKTITAFHAMNTMFFAR